jgi:prepilin-type N-terminal cleavage/methylation domain-containing protein
MPCCHKHEGFTLVELLVVVAIIGVLIAMLFPAVHAVREAGRRTVCSNNVRQLALGLMNYESSHGQLPIGLKTFEGLGTGGPAANRFYGMSWITRILPFIEQNGMWENAVEDYRYSPIPFRSHRGMQTVLPAVALVPVIPTVAKSSGLIRVIWSLAPTTWGFTVLTFKLAMESSLMICPSAWLKSATVSRILS